MGMKLWRWALLQAFLHCWSWAGAQVPGFVSIDCGSTTTFTDALGIEWIPDAELMQEGDSVALVGAQSAPYSTLRLFSGNQSKYCYSLSIGAVHEGAFFLLRASFWATASSPYTPIASDQQFHFKLLIDADEWTDVDLSNNSTSQTFYEIYTRALDSRIDVCLARSTPDGDAPFISALELRPLPSTVFAPTALMNSTNHRLFEVGHHDLGCLDTGSRTDTRYPSDSLDREWQWTDLGADLGQPGLTTESAIHTSADQDMVPVEVLQTACIANTSTMSFGLRYYDLGASNGMYYCALYFAEIDQAVNASGQRVFNIVLNGKQTVNAKPIDVFAEVGPNAAHEIFVGPITPTDDREFVFNFTATSTSLFPPFYAASEIFRVSTQIISSRTSPSDVSSIEDLKRNMNLSTFSGDPCLPQGFGYSFLTCDTTLGGLPRIVSISLSNYSTGGGIPKTINTLTMLNKILLNGNNLVGSIPDMSDLERLETLDLSNNKLTGSIPESLATLNNLKVLYLMDNNLTGEIPQALLERKLALTLDFQFSGNPLCQNNTEVMCTSSTPSSSTPSSSTPSSSTPSSSTASFSNTKSNIKLIIGAIIAIFLVLIHLKITLL